MATVDATNAAPKNAKLTRRTPAIDPGKKATAPNKLATMIKEAISLENVLGLRTNVTSVPHRKKAMTRGAFGASDKRIFPKKTSSAPQKEQISKKKLLLLSLVQQTQQIESFLKSIPANYFLLKN